MAKKDKVKDHIVFVSHVNSMRVPELRVAKLVSISKKSYNVEQSKVCEFYGSVVRKVIAHKLVTEAKAMLIYQEYVRSRANFYAARLTHNQCVKGLVE